MGKLYFFILLAIPSVIARSWTEDMPATPPIPVFDFPAEANRTISINNEWTGTLSEGYMKWKNATSAPASFSVLQSLLPQNVVSSILAELAPLHFDEDEDSVDGLATFEFYLQRSGDIDQVKHIHGKPDQVREIFESRKPIRKKLEDITKPYLTNRIVPLVNMMYSGVCSGNCYVCHSLVRTLYMPSLYMILNKIVSIFSLFCLLCQIRRYRDGERLAHPRHFDTQALVTAVISLSSSGRDYDGGLYVSTGTGQNESYFLALQSGDVVSDTCPRLSAVV